MAASAAETQTSVASPNAAKPSPSQPVVSKGKKGSFYGKSKTPAAALPKIKVSLGHTLPSRVAPLLAPAGITSSRHSKASPLRGGLEPSPSGLHAEGAALGDVPGTKQPAGQPLTKQPAGQPLTKQPYGQPLTAFGLWTAGMPLAQATPAEGLLSGPAAHAEATRIAQVKSCVLMVCCIA